MATELNRQRLIRTELAPIFTNIGEKVPKFEFKTIDVVHRSSSDWICDYIYLRSRLTLSDVWAKQCFVFVDFARTSSRLTAYTQGTIIIKISFYFRSQKSELFCHYSLTALSQRFFKRKIHTRHTSFALCLFSLATLIIITGCLNLVRSKSHYLKMFYLEVYDICK